MGIASLGVYVCLFLALYFEVFLLISFLEQRPAAKTALRPRRYPSVSMVVPCFNEGRTLAQTIESLLSLDYPEDKLNIMVIDDGSSDNTREIGEAFALREPRVSFFHKENGGKYTALNYAIEHSHAELIGCLDADSFAEKDALLEVVKRFEEDESIAAIVPVMKVHNPKGFLERMQAIEYVFGIVVKKIFDNLGAISVLPGPFSIYRRSVFKEVGLFRHAHNTEDMEIAFRIQKHGLRIVNAHTAFVYTTVPKTIKTLIKQRTRWTQGFLQNSQDYRHMFFNPKFGHFGMFSLPFSLILFFASLYMALYLVFQFFYQTTNSVINMLTTGAYPRLTLEMPNFDWFFFDTSTKAIVIVATLAITVSFLLIGRKIACAKFGVPGFFYYFFLYGFLSPLWLVPALWGTLRAQESSWR